MTHFETQLKALGLTPREIGIVDLVAQGLSNDAIAKHFGVSEKTVKTRLTQVYRVLKVASRTQLIVKVLPLKNLPESL